MTTKITDDEGNEIEVYTAEEVEQQRATAVTAARAEADVIIKQKDTDIEALKKVSAEKTENFKRYNEMTQEEKDRYDANTTELLKRSDQTAAELADTKKKLEERDIRDRDSAKNNALSGFHGGKEDIKKTLEEKYAILAGMPETTPEEIKARATEAAKLAGISIDSVNPLYQRFDGDAPRQKESKDYVESPDGKTAADLVRQNLGIKEPKK